MISPIYTEVNVSSPEPKKIAFVSNTSFSLYNFRLGVMKSFVKEGYQVYAIALEDRYSRLFQQESITYIPLNINGKGTNLFQDLKLYRSILKLYKSHRFDFIFHYTVKPVIYGSYAAGKLNIPSVAVTTGLGYAFDHDNWLKKMVLFLYKNSLKKVKDVWFLNESDRETFIQEQVIKKNEGFVLPGEGIDVERFSPVNRNEDNQFTFLFLSRLVKEKGIEEYVMAAKKMKAKYPEIRYQVLGITEIGNPNNISRDTILEWDKKGYIDYLGASMDVRPFIADCDCVVLPSYYHEGVPRCLMESLSMERPIITTNNVGCIELIRNEENGLICCCKDVDDLADKMEKLYQTDRDTLAQWGKNGRELILNHFDEKKIIAIYHQKLSRYIN